MMKWWEQVQRQPGQLKLIDYGDVNQECINSLHYQMCHMCIKCLTHLIHICGVLGV